LCLIAKLRPLSKLSMLPSYVSITISTSFDCSQKFQGTFTAQSTPKIRTWMQTILCYSIRKMKQTLRSLLSIREQYGVAGWDTSVVLNGAVLLGLSLARYYQWIPIYIVLRCRICVFQVFSWALQRCRTGLYMHFSSLGSSQALPYTICDLSLNLRIDSSLGSQARSEVFVGI
jgi:hypothetical protein